MHAEDLKRWIYSPESPGILELIKTELASQKMNWPLFVITTDQQNTVSTKGEWVWSQGHLEHHFFKNTTIESKFSYLVNSIQELRHALQQGIVQLREKQIKAWVVKMESIPSKEIEDESLSLCQRFFWQTQQDSFKRQLKVLIHTLMLRYKNNLNSYRIHLLRAWIELWQQGELTEDDELNSFCVHQINQISNETNFLTMAEHFEHTLIEFQYRCHKKADWQKKVNTWPDIVQNAYYWISKHFNEPISLRDVAKAAYVSAPYLSKVFKKNTGLTIVEEINEQRLVWARSQFKAHPHTVTQIALEAGFNSSEHFQRLYKKKFGVSPGRDRGFSYSRNGNTENST